MGTGALALAALAAGATTVNTQQTAKRADREAAAGIRQQSNIQRDADARLRAEIGEIGKSDPEAERKESRDQFLQQLQRSRAQIDSSTADVSGASDEFRSDVDENAIKTQQLGRRVSDLLSRIDAPGLQRRGEAERFGRFATDLGGLGRRSSGENFLTQLRLRNVRRNPFLDAFASFGGSFAGAQADASGGATALPAPNVTGSNVRPVRF